MTRIVVLGGSFNPPTIGHYLLMQSAIKTVGADKGIFLPASQRYVERKMARKGAENETMPDSLRLGMLQVMCQKFPALETEDFEITSGKTDCTFESLLHIQEKNPDAEIYFITGSDKLKIIRKWRNSEEFLKRFRILVATRNDDNYEELLEEIGFSSDDETFCFFETPAVINEISSSAVREMYGKGKGEAARQFLFNGTADMFEEFAEKTFRTINDFHAEGYEFLSNFYKAPVTYKGLTYQSVEAAFQAQKVLNDEEKLPFTTASPGQAKRLGRTVDLRCDWEFVKVNLMLEIVRAKFRQNSDLAEKLLATGNAMLVEGNRWHDTFWGVDLRNGKGENYLGKILMCVRKELKNNNK